VASSRPVTSRWAANYDPLSPTQRSFFHNSLMDEILQQDNDLVVPAASVRDRNGAGSFPIKDRHVLENANGIDHGGYFSSQVGQEKILFVADGPLGGFGRASR
jgi:hypothetical protein